MSSKKPKDLKTRVERPSTDFKNTRRWQAKKVVWLLISIHLSLHSFRECRSALIQYQRCIPWCFPFCLLVSWERYDAHLGNETFQFNYRHQKSTFKLIYRNQRISKCLLSSWLHQNSENDHFLPLLSPKNSLTRLLEHQSWFHCWISYIKLGIVAMNDNDTWVLISYRSFSSRLTRD